MRQFSVAIPVFLSAIEESSKTFFIIHSFQSSLVVFGTVLFQIFEITAHYFDFLISIFIEYFPLG